VTVREVSIDLRSGDRVVSTWDMDGEMADPRPGTDPFPTGPRWAVHLVVDVPSLADALRMAERVATSLAFLPQIDQGETTVSAEDHQSKRYRVFCDRALPDRSRCTLPPGHDGACDHGAHGHDEGANR